MSRLYGFEAAGRRRYRLSASARDAEAVAYAAAHPGELVDLVDLVFEHGQDPQTITRPLPAA